MNILPNGPLAAIAFVAVLAGCAPTTDRPKIDPTMTASEAQKQREMFAADDLKTRERLDSVAYRVLTANAAMCGEKVRGVTGVRLHSALMFPADWRGAYKAAWGLTDEMQITRIDRGSPAEAAGVQPGDVLIALNDWKVPTVETELKQIGEKLIELGAKPAPIKITVRRQSEMLDITVDQVKRCDYPVQLRSQDIVNAFANGKAIFMTTGMMRFLENDDELALVLGHELGHNVMAHVDKMTGNRAVGAIFGAILTGVTGVNVVGVGADVGQMAYSKEFESEADYVGLYYTARAGYDITNVASLWRRMAVRHPKSIGHGVSHPSTAQRFVQLEAAAKEIEEKRGRGLELTPELRAGSN